MKMPVLLFVFLLAVSAAAQEKTFIREYIYSASEDDSRNSARGKALDQVKTLLLEEVGIYIEGTTKLALGADIDQKFYSVLKKEMQTITAGITGVKILEENWDGYKYTVEAQITVNPDDVIKKVNQAIEARVSNEEIERLKALLTKSEGLILQNQAEIEALQKAFQEKQMGIEEKEKRLVEWKKELAEADRKLQQMTLEERRLSAQADEMVALINSQSEKAVKIFRPMLKVSEVWKLLGEDRAHDIDPWRLNYGKVWIVFDENDFTDCVVKHEYYDNGHGKGCRWYRDYHPKAIVK